MSVVKTVQAASLNIEVQNGVDKAGDPTYVKRSYSGVRLNVDPANAYAVAEAIKAVLEGDTKSTLLSETSNLVEE